MAGKGDRRASRLYAYAEKRASTLASLAFARTLALVLATSLGIFLVTDARGHTWGVLPRAARSGQRGGITLSGTTANRAECSTRPRKTRTS